MTTSPDLHRAAYLTQALDQVKAAAAHANGRAIAEVVNRMAEDGYVDEANTMAMLIAVTLLESMRDQGVPDEVIQLIIEVVESEDD